MAQAMSQTASNPSRAPGPGLLRFMTCGSVDDGKSTLIGRLLYDIQQVYDDQMAALARDSRSVGTTGGDLDFALLVDGLEAERQQGITIDVAYRYFSSAKRSFIVADVPGHEQYTRNMATGASVSDLAIILIDARKGVLTQTRRHSYIAHLLGIRHVVLAVNKMDLIGYSESAFNEIVADYREFASGLAGLVLTAIPVVATAGDNIVLPSRNMSWHGGPTLLDHLDAVEPDGGGSAPAFRFPVQSVMRPDATFRGLGGTVTAGAVSPGDDVVVLPSGVRAKAARIVTFDGEPGRAARGDSVVVVLDREVDASRGSVLATATDPPELADQVSATLIWMGEEPMLSGRSYGVKLATQSAVATITTLKHTINIDNLERLPTRRLELNDVGSCNLSFSHPLVFEPYEKSRDLGGFILIDRYSNKTVGAGLIEHGLRRATNIRWQALTVDKSARAASKRQTPCCLWFTGLSGSGKSTIANLLEQRLFSEGRHTYVLDGDNIRHGLNRDLGFTDADRVENIRRVAEVARLMIDSGLLVIVSFISPFRSERRMARELMGEGEFLEVFVDTPLEICERRDAKGLYQKARRGDLPNFTGISSPYEVPERPEIRLDGASHPPEALTEQVLDELKRRGLA